MSLRRRLVLLCAAAVAAAVVAVAAGSYVAVRGELRGQVDEALSAQAGVIAAIAAQEGKFQLRLDDLPAGVEPPLIPPGGDGVSGQLIDPEGEVTRPPGNGPALPVSEADLAIASGGEQAGRIADVDIDGEAHRVLTEPLPGGGAIQIGRSLAGVEGVLSDLRIFLVLLGAAGVAIAAGLAWLVSRSVIAPITRLTEAAEHISETADLSRRIDSPARDELGRLADQFDSMLETIERSRSELSASVAAQRQLVADASHELRTPVASLRTDIESLLEHPDQPNQPALLRACDERLEELTALIADVIELGRGDDPPQELEEIRFDDLVAESVERMRGLRQGRGFELALEPTVIEGQPDRIARAVSNLLDNACKYSPRDEPVAVSLRDGVLAVRDRGPGIPEDELPHIFDRFYRGSGSRDRSGSGLGLAIVSQVAAAGGGEAWAANDPGGGAVVSFRPGPYSTTSRLRIQ